MLALYRTGRQVDALRAFQQYRQVLAEELGLAPSPELVDLDRRILAHDTTLQLAEPAGLPLRGYRLGERLGTGRNGTVYAARLPGVERDFAIRIMRDEIADQPEFVRSFEASAQRVASLRHEAIVAIQDYWREPGAAYLVMRRMRGGTLRDRLDRGPMPGAEVATLAARIGSALTAAAEQGIVHGRLVPESVLFDDAGAAYLSDFELGTDAARQPGDDVRGLAALVCEALTGHPPVGSLVDGMPAAVADVMVRGLAPADRPPLAEFVPELVAALTGEALEPLAELPNPYKGLRAFEEADAGDFFGRVGLVDEILAQLAARRPARTARLGRGRVGQRQVERRPGRALAAGPTGRESGGPIGGSSPTCCPAGRRSKNWLRDSDASRWSRPMVWPTSSRSAREGSTARCDGSSRRGAAATGRRPVRGALHARQRGRAAGVPRRPDARGFDGGQPVAGRRHAARRLLRPAVALPSVRHAGSGRDGHRCGDVGRRARGRRRRARPSGRVHASSPRWSPSWSARCCTSRRRCRHCSTRSTSWPSVAMMGASPWPTTASWVASTRPSRPGPSSSTVRWTMPNATRFGGCSRGSWWSAPKASRPGAAPHAPSWRHCSSGSPSTTSWRPGRRPGCSRSIVIPRPASRPSRSPTRRCCASGPGCGAGSTRTARPSSPWASCATPPRPGPSSIATPAPSTAAPGSRSRSRPPKAAWTPCRRGSVNSWTPAVTERDREQRREAERIERQARANRRLRIQLAALAVALVVALVVGFVAVDQRQRANKEARVARPGNWRRRQRRTSTRPRTEHPSGPRSRRTEPSDDGSVLPEAEEALHRAVDRFARSC